MPRDASPPADPADVDPRRPARARMAERLRTLRRRFRMRQEELVETQQRLARAERAAALGMLIGQIAHELGTPLHSISGHLQLILEGETVSTPVRERLQIVSGEVGRLHRLIQSHLAALRTPLPRSEPARLNALVSDTLLVMRPLLDAARVSVGVELDEALDAPIACDAGQIQQALVNLVQNAIDATPEGGAILVRTGQSAGRVALSVCDDGQGLDPALAEHVFDPSFTSKGSGKGNGLGLSICREIARRHGGEVIFDSAPGMGTVVTLTLDGER